jgi:hypothetical protein
MFIIIFQFAFDFKKRENRDEDIKYANKHYVDLLDTDIVVEKKDYDHIKTG